MLRPPVQSIRSILRRIWTDGYDDGLGYVPASKYMLPVQKNARVESYNIENFQVMNWCLLVDEVSLVFSMIFIGLKAGKKTSGEQELCIKFLFGSLCAQINCIRSVILAGFDVQARTLCRTLGKYADLTVLLFLEPSLCTEYKKAEGPEQANIFWHKYISKGKLKRRIFDNITTGRHEFKDFVDIFMNYERKEELMMGSALHPSYMGAAMTAAGGVSYGKGGSGIFGGGVDPLSLRTLHYIFYKCTFIIVFCRDDIQGSVKNYVQDEKLLISIDRRLSFLLKVALFVEEHRKDVLLSRQSQEES